MTDKTVNKIVKYTMWAQLRKSQIFSVAALHANTSKNIYAYENEFSTQNIFRCAPIQNIANVPWKPHIRNIDDKKNIKTSEVIVR